MITIKGVSTSGLSREKKLFVVWRRKSKEVDVYRNLQFVFWRWVCLCKVPETSALHTASVKQMNKVRRRGSWGLEGPECRCSAYQQLLGWRLLRASAALCHWFSFLLSKKKKNPTPFWNHTCPSSLVSRIKKCNCFSDYYEFTITILTVRPGEMYVPFPSNTTMKAGNRTALPDTAINGALMGRDGQKSAGKGNSGPERPMLLGWLCFTFVHWLPPFSKSQRLCYPQVARTHVPPATTSIFVSIHCSVF